MRCGANVAALCALLCGLRSKVAPGGGCALSNPFGRTGDDDRARNAEELVDAVDPGIDKSLLNPLSEPPAGILPNEPPFFHFL